MRKLIASLLVILMAFIIVGCKSENTIENSTTSTKSEPTSKEKAINYVMDNGISYGSNICVAYEKYFLDDYYTYFIVYNTSTKNFSFECYKADKYYELPPASNQGVNVSVEIDIATGKAKYYSDVSGSIYTGSASIDIANYSSTSYNLSDLKITGKYAQVYSACGSTFKSTACTTVMTINSHLKEDKTGLTVADFGFVAFEK